MDNEVFSLSKHFSLRVIKLYKYLTAEHHEYTLSKQVLKSGTSIGANISEALVAQSKADFTAKMQIALKECSETLYWLELLQNADYISEKSYLSISADCRSLFHLLTAIVKKSKNMD
jgi:four helix bundle protein